MIEHSMTSLGASLIRPTVFSCLDAVGSNYSELIKKIDLMVLQTIKPNEHSPQRPIKEACY